MNISGSDIIQSAAETNDGSILITHSNSIISKINSSGKLIWTKTITGKHFGESIHVDNDGHFILIGWDNIGVSYIKIDSEGNLLDQKTISSENSRLVAIRSKIVGENEIIVGGYEKQNKEEIAMILKVDKNGNKIRKKPMVAKLVRLNQ